MVCVVPVLGTMWIWRRVLTTAIAGCCSFALIAGCSSPQDSWRAEKAILEDYRPRYEEMRERIAAVPELLPEGGVTKDSCDARPDPKFEYTTLTPEGDPPTTGNAEIMTMSQIDHPDTLVKVHDDFAFAGSALLSAIRLTGNRGPLGSGEFAFESGDLSGSSNVDSTGLLKRFLKNGLKTRHLVVLRVRDFQSPGVVDRTDGDEFFGEVRLDAFVVDLVDAEVTCRLRAGYDIAERTLIEYPPREGLEPAMYRLIQEAAGEELSAKLTDLTGGSSDVPLTEGGVCEWMGDTVTRTENTCL